MKIKIGSRDIMVLDRGQEDPRYTIIVNDNNYDLVDDKGIITDIGKKISANAMDNEAVKNGATVIPASTCVDGGDFSKYSDDRVVIFNAGDTAIFVAEDLGKELISAGLVTEKVDW